MSTEFDRLIAEANKAHFSGWDFSYLDGRWLEEPPTWDYRQLVTERISAARSLLDMGTGGGEFLASLPYLPPHTCATEAYPPNLPLAKSRLEPLGVRVFEYQEDDQLPFESGSFDLIINRHESYSPPELARILLPGGLFITQQVGGRDNIELNQRLAAALDPDYAHWTLEREVEELRRAGFRIVAQEEASPRTFFNDVGAVVYYLRAIPWQLPGFSTELYRDGLQTLHEEITTGGPLITRSHRFFIEAVRE